MSTVRRWPLRRRPGRRDFLKLAGIGSGAALLAACGPAGGGGAAPTATSGGAVGGERVPVSFWTPGGSDVFCQGFNTIAENFEAVEPGIDITEVVCGTGDEQFSYNEQLLANIAAGTPPDSTILWTSPVAFAVRNALEPLDDLMANSKYSQLENWPPGVLASCQYQGKTYGLPATAGTYGIYYNQEMFEALGISSAREDFPKTWDELLRLSNEFVRWNGDTLEQAGIMPWIDAVEVAIWSALNGSQLYDTANNKFTIDSPQNVEMMEWGVRLLDEQYKGDWVKVQASGNFAGYADGQGRPPAFQEGKLAMVVQGFWYNGDMYGSEFKGWERWDAAPFPVGPQGSTSVSGYWPNWMVIPRGSKNKELAFKYLDYMSAEGIKVWFNNIPDLPANKLVPDDLIPGVVIEKRGREFAENVNNFFRGQLDVATPMWTAPVQDFANDQIARATDRIINKAATPAEALAEAQAASQGELERVLKENA